MFAHYRTWSILSKTRVEKKQLKRLLIIEKRRLRKENPAGFLSQTPRHIKVVRQRQPEPVEVIPEPPVRIPRQKQLAGIARKYKSHDEVGFARLKHPRSNARELAIEVASGRFAPVLAKYRGFNSVLLMESVIDFVRTERPKIAPITETAKVRGPKQLTPRQQLQSERTPAPPPSPFAPSNTRKGAAKTVPTRRKCDDAQIVQDALDALLQSDPDLKALFCEATDPKGLHRVNEQTVRLARELKARLASPTRVSNYLDMAVRVLIPQYVDEQLAAEETARIAAEARRKQEVAAARELAASREQQRQRRVHTVGPSYWRELNRA